MLNAEPRACTVFVHRRAAALACLDGDYDFDGRTWGVPDRAFTTSIDTLASHEIEVGD